MQLDQQKKLYGVRFQVYGKPFVSCCRYPEPSVVVVHKSMSMLE
jgi:hypothetical protein